MLASACLTEENVEGVISSPNGLVIWHLAISLDVVFQALELLADVSDLNASLTNRWRCIHTQLVLKEICGNGWWSPGQGK